MTPPTPDPAEVRVVVESNVWISALVFGGAPRPIFEAIVRDGLRLVVSAEALLDALKDHLDSVSLGSITIEECRDPDDNRVLETAVLGVAASIVSGDKDLVILGDFEGVSITTPHDWLERRPPRPADRDLGPNRSPGDVGAS
jgi:predicted nucleic acid-binding protein